MQYVGKVGDGKDSPRQVNHRFTEHRDAMRKCVADPEYVTLNSPLLARHFDGRDGQTERCKVSDITITPIEVVSRGVQPEIRERHWIRTLRTFRPYGLNDRLDDGVRKTKWAEERFDKLPIRRGTRGSRKKGKVPFLPEEYLKGIMEKAQTKEWLWHARVRVNALTRKKQWQLLCELHRESGAVNQTKEQVRLVLLDLLGRRTSMGIKTRPEKTPPELVWKVPFVNPGLNRLGLERMLHSKKLEEIAGQMTIKKPTVVYTYTEQVRNQVLNYTKVVKGIKETDFARVKRQATWQRVTDGTGRLVRVDPQQPPPCSCNSFSSYVNPALGHVMTGDLRLVPNPALRRLLSFGPSYREPVPINWDKVSEAVLGDSLGNLLETWEKKEGTFTRKEEWRKTMTEMVKKKIERLNKGWVEKDYRALSSPSVKRDLQRLQQQFVLVPADKSAQNIVLVCKRFYVDRLIQEVTDEEKKTYTPQQELNEWKIPVRARGRQTDSQTHTQRER